MHLVLLDPATDLAENKIDQRVHRVIAFRSRTRVAASKAGRIRHAENHARVDLPRRHAHDCVGHRHLFQDGFPYCFAVAQLDVAFMSVQMASRWGPFSFFSFLGSV
jgi:hypothetical protein